MYKVVKVTALGTREAVETKVSQSEALKMAEFHEAKNGGIDVWFVVRRIDEN